MILPRAVLLTALFSATTAAKFAITRDHYAVKNTKQLTNACAQEFGAGARTVDLDSDLASHKWSTVQEQFPDLERFTHYWALADSDYLDNLSDSRGVVVEYLWGDQVEPVLMGDREMPSFLKVQVLCQLTSDVQVQEEKQVALTASAFGHLHISTWSGEKLDFQKMQGSCHFTLLDNPHFLEGLGLSIRVRTKAMPMWSFMDAALVTIGTDTLEVASGGDTNNDYWVNGKYQGALQDLPFPVKFHQVNARQRDFQLTIAGTRISLKTFHQYVRVDVEALDGGVHHLEGSFGLMGSFPGGEWISNDQVTMMGTAKDFATGWTRPTTTGFSSPASDTSQCSFDLVSNRMGNATKKTKKHGTLFSKHTRRRLTEASRKAEGKAHIQQMTRADAEEACGKVHRDHPDRIQVCVQGIMELVTSHKEGRQADEEGIFADIYHALFYKNEEE